MESLHKQLIMYSITFYVLTYYIVFIQIVKLGPKNIFHNLENLFETSESKS